MLIKLVNIKSKWQRLYQAILFLFCMWFYRTNMKTRYDKYTEINNTNTRKYSSNWKWGEKTSVYFFYIDLVRRKKGYRFVCVCVCCTYKLNLKQQYWLIKLANKFAIIYISVHSKYWCILFYNWNIYIIDDYIACNTIM